MSGFPDGAWLAELAPVSDAALVPGAVAAALNVLGEPSRSLLEALAESLRGKRLLLVLDNCEHLLDAAADLCDELLRRCPEIRILVTSRQGLGVEGEWNLPVPSLGLPPQGADAAAVAVAGSEAGKLFLDRARAVLPGVQIDQANAGAVASLADASTACRWPSSSRRPGRPSHRWGDRRAARRPVPPCSVPPPGHFPATGPFVR